MIERGLLCKISPLWGDLFFIKYIKLWKEGENMQEEMGCITLVVLFVGALIISLFFTGFGLIGEFYTDIVGSDGWNIFIVILSLICGYFVYHQVSEDNNE